MLERALLAMVHIVWWAAVSFQLWWAGVPLPWWILPLMWALPLMAVPSVWLGRKVGLLTDV